MLSNGNHFKFMHTLTSEYKLPRNRAVEILLRAEQKGSCQVPESQITVSWNRKSGFELHAEKEEE